MKKYVSVNNFLCLFFLAGLLAVLHACSLTGTDENKTQIPIYPDTPVYTPSPDSYSEDEIIVKTTAAVTETDLDNLVAGVCIKTFAAIDGSRYFLYRIFDKPAVSTSLITLRASSKVLAAERNAVYALCAYQPDDPYYAQYQYAAHITRCDIAWEIEKGNENVIVAVLDTGINGEHEELHEWVTTDGQHIKSGSRVLAGKNIITGAKIPAGTNSDDNGHGSHVAGIIGAMGDNGKGIAGVNWHARLLPVKIFAGEGSTTSAMIAEGIIWAVDNGARVISMSFGGAVYSIAVNDAVNYALKHNVVLVAAMGNEYQYKISYPAALSGVIAVGSSNGQDKISFYSTKGSHISVSAPGQTIYSLRNDSDSGYTYMSGTSMATPFVAGLAALLISHINDLQPQQVRSLIEDTAKPLGTESFSPDYGFGRVDAGKALQAAAQGARYNDYGSVTVNVTNKNKPIGGVTVFLENNTYPSLLRSGLTSYGGTNGETAGQLIFPHVRLDSYTVKVQMDSLQTPQVVLDSNQRDKTVTCAFDTNLILLVNAVKADDITVLTDEFLYTQQLNKLNKHFTIWKTAYNGPPSSELVNAYDLVIWFTGRTKDNEKTKIEVIDTREIEVLKSYLDQGGRLFLCGNNIAESLNKSNPYFLHEYFHARFSDSPFSEDDDFYGRDFLTGMQLWLAIEDDDELFLESDATGLITTTFDDSSGNHWAGLVWQGDYRLVFTTITPNEILTAIPDTFFRDVLNWLEAN